MLDSLKQIFLMTWLWSIFAGFYLVAYSFWVPGLFASLPLVVLVTVATLALGWTFLVDGFSRAMQLQTGAATRAVPFLRARQLLGGLALLSYPTVYLPPGGRVVAHWPLDLAITLVSGVLLIAYALWGK
ncbi:MAG TPA: hypothetical protein VND40_06030 [Nitrososphaerales archaeon]|nr:hypothetical protein [Nitrososphaerales archaeon]